jgi:hypothetical protein
VFPVPLMSTANRSGLFLAMPSAIHDTLASHVAIFPHWGSEFDYTWMAKTGSG